MEDLYVAAAVLGKKKDAAGLLPVAVTGSREPLAGTMIALLGVYFIVQPFLPT